MLMYTVAEDHVRDTEIAQVYHFLKIEKNINEMYVFCFLYFLLLIITLSFSVYGKRALNNTFKFATLDLV